MNGDLINTSLSLPALLPASADLSQPDRATQKEVAAAKDFEALLIGQMLKSVREEGSGWLGADEDEAGATASSLGEEQLAKAMAAGGGLGISKVIASGLAARRAAQEETSQTNIS
jgi:Rod binding domain-containing protein